MSEDKKQGSTAVGALGGMAMLAALAWYQFGGGMEQAVAHESDRINGMVANDSVAQYEIAKRNGSPMDVCVAAGLVSAAHLQAKDEANYAAAKAREKQDCAKAGMPE